MKTRLSPLCRVALIFVASNSFREHTLVGVFAVFCVYLFADNCHAQTWPVPPMVQARYFKKIFAYDKTLPKEGLKLAVVYSDASADSKDDITQAFNAIGVAATAVKAGQLTGGAFHVAYACAGADIRTVREFCKANGALSITGLPKYVRDGDISIGMDNINEQPKIVVNADRLKIEKQDAPDLLRFR